MQRTLVSLLVVVLEISVCRASPGTDFERGNGVVLDHLRFTMNGNAMAAGPLELPKPGGSVDAVLTARDLGLAVDAVVHLHGTRSGDHVNWTFSEHFPRAIALGWPTWLDGIEGVLSVDLEAAPDLAVRMWANRVRTFDVLVRSAAGSRIRAFVHGPISSWTWDATGIDIAGAGGLGAPALSGAWVDGHGMCERTSQQLAAIEISMVSAVGGAGAMVWLVSSDAVHVGVGPVLVPAGASRAAAVAHIAPGWHGRTVVTARHGSVQIPMSVEVRDRQQCESSGLSVAQTLHLRDLPLPKLFGDCVACAVVLGFDEAEAVMLADKEQRLFAVGADGKERAIAPDLGRRVSALLGAPSVVRARKSGLAALGARVTPAWQAPPPDDDRAMPVPRKTALKGSAAPVAPVAMNRFGIGVALVPAGKLQQAVGVHGALQWSLGPPLAWKEVVGIDDQGSVVGTAELGKGVRAVVVADGKVVDLGTLGGPTSQSLAVNGAGEVVGVADGADGKRHGFVTRQGKLVDVGVLPGDTASAAVAINRAGWVAANSFDAKGAARPFLLSPSGKALAIPQAGLPAGVALAEALAINDDGSLVVRGRRGTQAKLFVLSARGAK